MVKRRCKPSLTRCPLRGRNCCPPRNAGHKSSSDTRHDEEPVVRSSAYFYSVGDALVQQPGVQLVEGFEPQPWREEAFPDQPDLVLNLAFLPTRRRRAGNRINQIVAAHL